MADPGGTGRGLAHLRKTVLLVTAPPSVGTLLLLRAAPRQEAWQWEDGGVGRTGRERARSPSHHVMRNTGNGVGRKAHGFQSFSGLGLNPVSVPY